VKKRFATKTPLPVPGILKEIEKFVQEWCTENLTPLAADSDVSVPTWLKNTKYSAARCAELLEKNSKVVSSREVRYHRVNSFMKDEVYPEYKHARAINSRTDEFKCATGPIFKLIEKEVFKLDWFIKKVPVRLRPAYILARLGHGRKFMATDYTAYESHFSRQIMQSIEFVLYEYMTQYLPARDEWLWLIHNVIGGRNHCVFKYFGVDINATRMSGEMNTSLGNGFSNLMCMLFLAKRLGNDLKDVLGVVEGDDGLFTMEHYPTAKDFESLGFTIKIEMLADISRASFCGLIFDPDDQINVTSPLEEFVTFGLTTVRYARSSQKRKMELLRCKALSMAYQYGGCPVLTSLARYALRVTDKYRARPGYMSEWERIQFDEMCEHYDGLLPEPPLKTRMLVEEEFGLTIETQLLIENYLNSLTELQPFKLPAVLDLCHPHWKHYWDNYISSIPVLRQPSSVNRT